MAERKRFNEQVAERLTEAVRTLLDDVPELDGVAIALTYNPSVGDPLPQCLVLGNPHDPDLLGRMCLQSVRLLQTHTEGMAAHFALAAQTRDTLQKEIDALKQQSAEAAPQGAGQAEGAATRDSAFGGPPDSSQDH